MRYPRGTRSDSQQTAGGGKCASGGAEGGMVRLVTLYFDTPLALLNFGHLPCKIGVFLAQRSCEIKSSVHVVLLCVH